MNINNDDNNNNENINDIIQVQPDKNLLLKNFDQRRINYKIKGITYNKNNNSISDWINPTILELEFQTNIYLRTNTFNIDYKKKQYNISILDNILDKDKIGIIPFSINKALYNNPKEFLKKFYYDEIIAQQIGDYFNILSKQKLAYNCQYIKFPRHILYELETNKKHPETENVITEEFQKNYRYILSEDTIILNLCTKMDKRTLQSFSHFSYQITGGQLLITDFEYDEESKMVKKFKIYNIKNNGYKNILEFFSSHICNNTCKTLDLIHPRKKIELNIKEEFFGQKYLTDIKLCQCCEVPVYMNRHKLDEKSQCCDICECREIATKYKDVCLKCGNIFFYSIFVYNCMLTKYPEYCEKCSNANIFNF
jgi:hypothetical protein